MSDSGEFRKDTFRFLKKLSQNNNKIWFNENKPDFESKVMQPAVTFVEEFGELLSHSFPDIRYDTSRNGSGSMFRIYRDVRFSKDKSPYKTNLGFVFWMGEGGKKQNPAIYVHVGIDGVQLYGGQYWMDKNHLTNFREAIIHSKSGEKLTLIMDKLSSHITMTGGLHYKRVPRGFDAENPRSEWLKYTGLYVGMPKFSLDSATSQRFFKEAEQQAKQVKPLLNWLKSYL